MEYVALWHFMVMEYVALSPEDFQNFGKLQLRNKLDVYKIYKGILFLIKKKDKMVVYAWFLCDSNLIAVYVFEFIRLNAKVFQGLALCAMVECYHEFRQPDAKRHALMITKRLTHRV